VVYGLTPTNATNSTPPGRFEQSRSEPSDKEQGDRVRVDFTKIGNDWDRLESSPCIGLLMIVPTKDGGRGQQGQRKNLYIVPTIILINNCALRVNLFRLPLVLIAVALASAKAVRPLTAQATAPHWSCKTSSQQQPTITYSIHLVSSLYI
jgi:hypothetical protein